MTCEQNNERTKGVAIERGRKSTLTPFHSCHRTRIPFRHVLIELRCGIKHCKRGCNKEKKDQPTTKRVPFQKHKTQKQNVWELWSDKTRVVVHSKHNNGRRDRRERERWHLLYAIVVTAPVFHLDTSELNLDAPANTAREGATKEKKDKPTTNHKKVYRFKNTRTK